MLEPFLKWPGGKRWLVHQYASLSHPNTADIWSRSWAEVLCFFTSCHTAQFSPTPIVNSLTHISASRSTPGQSRSAFRTFNETQQDALLSHSRRPSHGAIEQAVRFLYLNRTCFNGIYRVNLKGEFNVPIGTKDRVAYPEDYLQEIAACLRHASIRVADFEKTIDKAVGG